MFSGGVDSVVCLHKLVKQNIIPVLIHFKTGKLNSRHERQIKQIAKQLSPESPFYRFDTYQNGYYATWNLGSSPYYSIRWKLHGKNKIFVPHSIADVVVLGYTRWIYYDYYHKVRYALASGTQRKFIDFCRLYSLPI